jgi:hypothetical protein
LYHHRHKIDQRDENVDVDGNGDGDDMVLDAVATLLRFVCETTKKVIAVSRRVARVSRLEQLILLPKTDVSHIPRNSTEGSGIKLES